MVTALIVMSVITLISLSTAGIAMYSAYVANKANSEVAKQFVSIVMENVDKIDVYENGKHTSTSISFPNSEGF